MKIPKDRFKVSLKIVGTTCTATFRNERSHDLMKFIHKPGVGLAHNVKETRPVHVVTKCHYLNRAIKLISKIVCHADLVLNMLEISF